MKEKAVHPLFTRPRDGRRGEVDPSQLRRDHRGARVSLHAVSQRDDITFLVVNEENVLDAFS